MKALEEKILREGRVIDNHILKIDSFLNFQIDVRILQEIACYFKKKFDKVDRILTIEASGIAVGLVAAVEFGSVPLVFAKKHSSFVNKDDDKYISIAHSFTHNNDNNVYIDKAFIKPGENVLIVDDFLAAGSASLALVDIVHQAGANVVGVAVAVEKEFQGGRKKLEDQGIKVVSTARVVRFENNKPVFHEGD